MKNKNTLLVKAGCYTTNISMAVVSNVPPLLFLTFRSLYGISFSLLGLLVLVNFFTQLIIDLIFSFFSHKFNIQKTVSLTPLICVIGLIFFSASPLLFKGHEYLGLCFGTVIFSLAAGLGEVLISPTIAAIPSKSPDKEMSKLHSVYAWGAVGVVLFSTLFLWLFGSKNWQWLILMLSIIPLVSFLLFCGAEVPAMQTPKKTSVALGFFKNKTLWLCVGAIFFGGASELVMAQWCSSYLETALNIPKLWGDVFGVALFSAALGLGRTLYAKIGKNIANVLFLSSLGAFFCYLTAALTNIAAIGIFACAFTGFCVAMLWPGSLIVSSEKFANGGVFIYAIMAAGGDLGASIGPQLMGFITDSVISNAKAALLAQKLNFTTEQLGMKAGLLVAILFPLACTVITYIIKKSYAKKAE